MRDTAHVARVFGAYRIDTVITSVKPPLEDTHYKVFIELNLAAMLELVTAAKSAGVRYFIYVSSIAAGSHYIPHHMATEDDAKPFLTDYEAPYDLSKRIAEDFVLAAHEPSVFTTVAIRTSGSVVCSCFRSLLENDRQRVIAYLCFGSALPLLRI